MTYRGTFENKEQALRYVLEELEDCVREGMWFEIDPDDAGVLLDHIKSLKGVKA